MSSIIAADYNKSTSLGTAPPSNAPNVKGLSRNKAVEVMMEWFFTNFEDPVENTPWDEGEYVYIWGGPFDAREELNDAFGDQVTEATIEAAAEEIEKDGIEWVPNVARIRPENEIDNWAAEIRYFTKPPATLRLNRVSDLEFHPRKGSRLLLDHEHHPQEAHLKMATQSLSGRLR